MSKSRNEDNHVVIFFCPKCRWLPRACWVAQELYVSFEDELSSIAVSKAEPGVFSVVLNGREIWSRATEGRFPELKELKQLVRDIVEPSKDLGHSDREEKK